MDRRAFVKASVAGASAFALAGCISGDDDEEFPNQDIEWRTGPTDFYAVAQAVSNIWPDYLPQEVNIVVNEFEGWVSGTTDVYRADPDGYTIGWGNFPGTLVTQELEDVEFDLTEMTWLVHTESLPHWVIAHENTGYESIEDLQEADEVSFGTVGGTAAETGIIVGMSEMDVNYRIVHFDNAAESVTGVLREDVDCAQFPIIAPPMHDAIEDAANLVFTYEEEAPDIDPDAQTVSDAGYDDLTNLGVQRMIGGPPGIDDDVQEILSDSLIDALESDEFTDWAEENNRIFDIRGPEYADEVINTSYEHIEEHREALEEAYGG